jgi:hypothetical protein
MKMAYNMFISFVRLNWSSAMSLNQCHITIYFADKTNNGLKPMSLNFTEGLKIHFTQSKKNGAVAPKSKRNRNGISTTMQNKNGAP